MPNGLEVTKMLESKEISHTLPSEEEHNRLLESVDPIALIAGKMQLENYQIALQFRELGLPEDIINDFLRLSVRCGELSKRSLERSE